MPGGDPKAGFSSHNHSTNKVLATAPFLYATVKNKTYARWRCHPDDGGQQDSASRARRRKGACDTFAPKSLSRLCAPALGAFAFAILGWCPAPAASRPKPASPSHVPPMQQLYPSGKITFSGQGPGVVESGVQCDANGNIYLVSGASIQVVEALASSGLNLPLTRLSLESKSETQFPVASPEGFAARFSHGFYVDPRGDVYDPVVAMRQGPRYGGANWPHNLIVKYNHDGTVDSIIRLQPPQGVHLAAYKLAVFLDGNFLVSGVEVSGPHRAPAKPFTGIFDRGGGFVQSLTLPNDVQPTANGIVSSGPKVSGAPQHGAGGTVHPPSAQPRPVYPWPIQIEQGLPWGRSTETSICGVLPRQPGCTLFPRTELWRVCSPSSRPSPA